MLLSFSASVSLSAPSLATLGYLFRVALWPHCFASFRDMMENASITKVAHYEHVDTGRLQKRFPDLNVQGAVDLAPRIEVLGAPKEGGKSLSLSLL